MRTLKFWLVTLVTLLCSTNSWSQSYDFETEGLYYKLRSVKDQTVQVVRGETLYTGDIKIPTSVIFDGKEYLVDEIASAAFQNCSELTSIDLGNVKHIDNYAFQGCTSLKTLDLKQVRIIGENSFSNCSNLKSIDFKKVFEIGEGAFANCTAITSINLEKVILIKGNAFQHCPKLVSIKVGRVIPPITEGNTNTFEKNVYTQASLQITNGCKESYQKNNFWKQFPQMKESDHIYYFKSGKLYYKILSEVNKTVEVVVGKSAYSGDIIIPDHVTFKGEEYAVTEISDHAFAKCKNLTSIDFGNVKNIGMNAFIYCSGLNSIDLKNVSNIEGAAFGGCQNLTSINLRAVKDIEGYAFDNCNAITTVKTEKAQPLTPGTYLYGFRNPFNEEIYLKATLFVPKGSTNKYSEANYWEKFNSIREITEVTNTKNIATENLSVQGIEGQLTIKGSNNGDFIKIFTMDGQLVYSLVSNGEILTVSVPSNNIYTVQVGEQTFKLKL